MTPFRTHQNKIKTEAAGINVAAEIFMKENEQTFGDMENMKIIYEDFLIYRNNEKEHNNSLSRVLQRAEDCRLIFDSRKYKLSLKKVNYFGLVLAEKGVLADLRKVSTIKTATEPKKKIRKAQSFISMT